MTQKLETVLTAYLSTVMLDEERTLRNIIRNLRKQFRNLKKTTISKVLHNGGFIAHHKPGDKRVYWFLSYYDIDTMAALTKPEGRTYVFVDLDTVGGFDNPQNCDILQFLIDAAYYDTVFVHGYSSFGYDELKVDNHIVESLDIDRCVSFHQIEETTKQESHKLCATLASHLELVLSEYYDSTCFIITKDEELIADIRKMQDSFPDADLYASEDSPITRRHILACM